MRIVYVFTSLAMGGAERLGLALAGRMAGRGHTVALLVLKPRLPQECPTALRVVSLGMDGTPLSSLRGLAEARRFVREFRPDLLHSHSFHANMAARLLNLLVPVPVVVSTVHNVYEGGWARMMAYRLTDCLSRRTVAVSRAAALRYVRLRAVPRHKCAMISNGIDLAEFAPRAGRRAETRTALDAGEQFIWLTAGRIVPAKDYPNLLRAFARLRAARPDARLWVAAEAAGAEFDRLTGLAAELKLTGSVRWLGLRRDMPALLDAADGFVLASAWEGMPLAVGEAMAMEKPVVATSAGGVGELLGQCGLLVPSAAPHALASAMEALMRKSIEDRLALGRAARERIAAGFNMEAKADEWEALYRELTERG
jgi:glycosyltransferase involved in cell wall biosynthesis